MDLKKAIIIGGVILGLFTGWIILSGGKKQEDKTILSALDEQEEVSLAETTKEFSDAAGFKFSYPENLILSKNDNDEAYSSLTITSDEIDGNTVIEAIDTPAETIDEYLAQLKTAKDVKKVKVGGMDARQFTYGEKLITAGIDNEALFTFTTGYESYKDLWIKIHDKIISTFAFIPPQASEAQPDTSSSQPFEEEVIFEGEEVIE